ncbi:MAG TPA: ABC transporter ATP-binding protein [Virgibacillus sp.]|nr:ABC transporter ATP-binding protein [Virgibacillus sp.]
MKTSTEKALLAYAWEFKRGILFGIFCLMIAVTFELAGPLIAKRVIDDHILGVEGTWQEVLSKDQMTATYQNKQYKRVDRLHGNEQTVGNPVTILQVGTSYYFVDEEITLFGERSVDENQLLIIEQMGKEHVYPSTKLSRSDTYPFFKPEQKPIILLLGLYMALLLVAGVFQFSQTYVLQKTSNQIVRKIRNDVFLHAQKMPMQYYVDQPAGSIVSRITNDTEAIRDLYERVLSIIITSVIYMGGIFIALFMLDTRLALICLLLIPLLFGWMKLYKHFGMKYNQMIRSTLSKMNGSINESIQGMRIIQAFSREKETENEFEELNEHHFIYQRKLVKLSALTSYNLVAVLRNLAFVGFIWYFGSFSLEPGSIISIGMLYAIVDYLTRLFEPVTDIVNQLPLIEQARVAGNRVFKLMNHEGEEVDNNKIDPYLGEVSFKDVSFAYDGENDVLKDISFQIKSGSTVAFVGHTGSGKSTIMNLLFRFYDPQKGSIKIDGYSTEKWSRQQVRSHMGIVLQDPFLFTGTIISNVTMNDPSITEKMAIKALKSVGADRFIQKLSDGYQTKVSEGGHTFSLGERQLVSFARALAFDPAILILDEATANIDTETENRIQHALEIIQKDRTTMIIAHRLSTIQGADHIFVLEHGMIKEQGSHEELINLAGIYDQMYDLQLGQSTSMNGEYMY